MNSIYFNDSNYMDSNSYKEFTNKNKGKGYLNIRTYAANSAIPMSGIKIMVSKVIDNMKVIFFEGATDSSGVISSIVLPTPLIVENNTVIPVGEDYDIEASYDGNNLLFKITMYSNIQVLQNINLVPELRVDGSYYG